MKIKSLLIAMAAVAATAFTLSSCSSDDDPVNNYTQYQNAVDQEVSAQKQKSGNKKAILLVAFGSTWQQAFDAFDTTKAAYEADSRFKGYDVFVSYSSAICINRAAAGEHVADGAQVRNYYAPNFWLHAFGAAKYDEILVQSLQVIPGEEFTRVINYMKDFANNSLRDLDDEYLSKVTLRLGAPLLTDVDKDVPAVAKALDAVYGSKAKNGVVAFMGHGNPNDYDTYSANVRYTQLEEALQEINPNYYVGTVDMPDNYKQNVGERMELNGIKSGKMYLHPLMSIAGDHAHNDMGGVGEEYWDPMDPESEDNSWFEYFSNKGYELSENESILMFGLLEVAGVRNIWMDHTANAIADEALDEYYHSMFPED